MNNLINNIDKLHTTSLGVIRISKNLKINDNVVEFCKKKILDSSKIYVHGKNYYCENGNIKI